MFSLSKKPDRRIRYYEHNGNSLTIAPGAYGLATIWDKDSCSLENRGFGSGRRLGR